MLAPADRAALIALARASVLAGAAGKQAPAMPAGSAALSTPAGAFVTLHDLAGGLRGCIGYVEPRRALWETVRDAAREAALSDPRFEPVTIVEADRLAIEISVLGPLRRARATEVRTGEHGIVLSRGGRRGLLLVQVAVEHGWTAEQFLDAGCDKAGLPRTAWRDGSATLEIFTAEVFGP